MPIPNLRRIRTLPAVALMLLALPAHSDPLEEARSLFRDGQFAQAKTRLAAVDEGGPGRAESLYYRGRIALHNHERGRAVDLLDKAVSRQPDRADFHYWLGRAYGERARHANIFKRVYFALQTKDQFRKAVAADPDHLHSRVALVMYYLRAPGFMGGSREEAEHQVEEVARRNRVAGLLARGMLFEETDRPDRALALYRQATEQAPQHDRPYRWLGRLLREEGRYREAFAVYADRMQAEEPDWAAYYEFALTAYRSGQLLEQAQHRLRRYLDHGSAPEHPSRADALILLGQILEKQERTRQARMAFHDALEQAPHHPEAAEARAAM